MSGHSKWKTIKRQKGVKDVKRGAIFTKHSNAITVAVKQGGNVADPEGNFKLRLAIEAARADNMPKENIDRAIAKAVGKDGVNLEEAVYEGFGPGGFSVVVEAFTDNKQRTVAEVKNAFEKNGGTMGAQGSVMYQFERKGVITIAKKEKSSDDIFAIAVDSGAEDVEEVPSSDGTAAGDEALIYCKPEDLAKVRSYLAGKGITIKNAELIYNPIVLFPITDRTIADKAVVFLEKLEELDDVQKVFANFDIPDAIMS